MIVLLEIAQDSRRRHRGRGAIVTREFNNPRILGVRTAVRAVGAYNVVVSVVPFNRQWQSTECSYSIGNQKLPPKYLVRLGYAPVN